MAESAARPPTVNGTPAASGAADDGDDETTTLPSDHMLPRPHANVLRKMVRIAAAGEGRGRWIGEGEKEKDGSAWFLLVTRMVLNVA